MAPHECHACRPPASVHGHLGGQYATCESAAVTTLLSVAAAATAGGGDGTEGSSDGGQALPAGAAAGCDVIRVFLALARPACPHGGRHRDPANNNNTSPAVESPPPPLASPFAQNKGVTMAVTAFGTSLSAHGSAAIRPRRHAAPTALWQIYPYLPLPLHWHWHAGSRAPNVNVRCELCRHAPLI